MSNSAAVNPALESVISLVDKAGVVQFANFSEVEITLHPEDSEVFGSYVDQLARSIDQECSIRRMDSPVSKQELEDYVRALLEARVRNVRGEKSDFTSRDDLIVPSFFSIILENVGLAYEPTLEIKLVPKIEYKNPLKLEGVKEISRKLRSLGQFGFQYALSLPRDSRGSWDFMAMQWANDAVTRHDKLAHPAYALLASVLALKGLETALVGRVTYGKVGLFRSLIRDLSDFARV